MKKLLKERDVAISSLAHAKADISKRESTLKDSIKSKDSEIILLKKK